MTKLEKKAIKYFGINNISYRGFSNPSESSNTVSMHIPADKWQELCKLISEHIDSTELEKTSWSYRTAMNKARTLKMFCNKGIEIDNEF